MTTVRVAFVASFTIAVAAPAWTRDPGASLERLSLDRGFAGGRPLASIGEGPRRLDALRRVAIDHAGRIVVAGLKRVVSGTPEADSVCVPAVARLDVNGALDSSFGTGGVAMLPLWTNRLGLRADGFDPSPEPGIAGLAIDASGRIVVTGAFHPTGSSVGPLFGAARLTDAGALDAAFSGDGILELDAAEFAGFGAVHASGTDGAMIVSATRPGTGRKYLDPPPVAGIVRITADGAVDAAYAGGFASLGAVELSDFAVDADGRAVVAKKHDPALDPAGVVRLDADGARDPSFGTQGRLAAPWGGALDGALAVEINLFGEIVVRAGNFVQRFGGDGAPIPSSAGGDPVPLAHGFPGAGLGTGVLATLKNEPLRLAVASSIRLRDRRGTPSDAYGYFVQIFDPAAPTSVRSYVERMPRGTAVSVSDLVVSDDGAAAVAVGHSTSTSRGVATVRPMAVRVDLTRSKALPLPDLQLRWVGRPSAIGADGAFEIRGRVRARNVGRGVVPDAAIRLFLSPDGVSRNEEIGYADFRTSALAPGRAVVRRFRSGFTFGPGFDVVAGMRVIAAVDADVWPDADADDNVAVSAPLR